MRDETDQRYKTDNKVWINWAMGPKGSRRLSDDDAKLLKGRFDFKVERIFGKNGVNGHEVCE